ncbi:hypothetical protein TL16_g05008 [Triparma laevis f. inornata]|uniref:Toprim domain-containing protein n=1 Tax=Triparma laevis f. inornata TaxID=1714386 RepID=A0A9W7E8C3_9STRA|nr:hypothetical protein TL16_g05008 [Triparma laevis f. inornata]
MPPLGDIVQFVRLWKSQIEGNGDDIGYRAALLEVGKTFTDMDVSSLTSSSPSSKPSPLPPPPSPQISHYLKILSCAHSFYVSTLLSPTSGPSRAYLSSRNLNPTLTRTYGIGTSPPTSTSCIEHIKSTLNVTDSDLVLLGIATQKSTGKHIETGLEKWIIKDKFINRLIIPITNENNDVIGFSGRLLPSDNFNPNFTPPKYLNSPSSPIFSKSKTLFSLSISLNLLNINSTLPILIVEGYMDSIALTRVGIPSVAIMGSSVTGEQFEVIKRRFKNRRIILALDFDEAGREGTGKFLRENIKTIYKSFNERIEVWDVEGFKDPGEYLDTFKQSEDIDKVRSQVLNFLNSNTIKWLDFLLKRTTADATLDNLSDKIIKISDVISCIPQIQRTTLILKSAKMLDDSLGGGADVKIDVRIRLEEDIFKEIGRREKVEDRFRSSEDMKRVYDGGGGEEKRERVKGGSVTKDGRVYNVTKSTTKKNIYQSNRYAPTPPRYQNEQIEKVGVEFSQPTDQAWLGKFRTLNKIPYFKPVYGGTSGVISEKIDDRAWLFNILTGQEVEGLPVEIDEGGSVEQVREYLMGVEGRGDGWFEEGERRIEKRGGGGSNVTDFIEVVFLEEEEEGEEEEEVDGEVEDITSAVIVDSDTDSIDSQPDFYENFGGYAAELESQSDFDYADFDASDSDDDMEVDDGFEVSLRPEVIEEDFWNVEKSKDEIVRNGTLDSLFVPKGYNDLSGLHLESEMTRRSSELAVQESLAFLLKMNAFRHRDKMLEGYGKAVEYCDEVLRRIKTAEMEEVQELTIEVSVE